MAELELSLSDVIENEDLPITVRVTRPCILKQEEVLKMNQYLTIINRRLVQLIFGKDWNGKEFRINTDDGNSVIIETVDVFYPKNIQEVLDLSQTVSFIQLKNKFGFGVHICEIGERFMYSNHSEHINSDGEKTLSFIREADNSIVHLPIEALLNENLFVFVFVKEKLNLQTLLRSFQPQKVRFVNAVADKTLPAGVVSLESVLNYDSVLSATIISPDTVRYELFPIHKRIMVEKCTALPQFIQTLGEITSKPFEDLIKEVLFMMFFDIYAGRLYGSVNLETSLQDEDLYLVDSTWYDPTMKATEEKPTRIFNSRTTQHNSEEEDGETVEPLQFARRRPTSSIFSAFASKTKFKSKKKIKKTSSGSNKDLQNDDNLRTRCKSDSSMAFQFITGETLNIAEKTDVISQQQNIERINPGMQPKVTPDDLRNVLSKTPNEGECSSKVFETENPIYGFDSPATPRRNLDGVSQPNKKTELVSIKSKPLSGNELRLKKISSPFSTSSFASPDESDILSKSLPESELQNVDNRRGAVYVPLNDHSRKARRMYSRSPDDDVNFERSDSGIDSPDNRKSLDNLYKTFESRNLDENIVRSDSTISVAEKIKLLENNITIQVQEKKKPPPNKPKRSFGTFDKSRKLSEWRRSKSEPNLDYVHSETLLLERPKSLEFPSTIENPYTELIYAQIRSPPSYRDMEQKREVESLNEIKALSLCGVSDLLTSLGLGKYKAKFEKEMLKGELLYKVSESAFHEELNLTKFEARKLYRYIHGWRACHKDLRASSLKYADIKAWSVTNVRNELTGINLRSFATFCAEHDVDGHLLFDFLDDPNLLDSLSSHGVRLSSIESERFRSYVRKELNYDEEEKKRAVAANFK